MMGGEGGNKEEYETCQVRLTKKNYDTWVYRNKEDRSQ